MDTQPNLETPGHVPPAPTFSNFWETNKVMFKGLMIGFLMLLMIIPAALISDLVQERAQRQQAVFEEISGKWAEPQTVTGPILMLPYQEYNRQSDGKVILQKSTAYVLPGQLDIKGRLSTEKRHRSLYEVTLYRTDLTLTGSFDPLKLQALNIDPENVLWEEARLMLGLSDARGLEDEVQLEWNNNSYTLEGGLPENQALTAGLNIPVPCDKAQANTFHIKLKVKGSSHLYFTPVGKVTTVQLQSPWKDPAFDGKFLPNNPEVSESGFNAQWKVMQASRNFPQVWANSSQNLAEASFGVKLIQPTDSYAKTERSVKYALLFIGLTFAVFFFMELLQKKQVHPLQYLLVGIALTVFYTLLLSLSEYLGFNTAYAIAASGTITLIGLYVRTIFKKNTIALGFTVALGALYAYIFFLIQLQDYALLFGSIGLFIVVALAMYSSRKVDWYAIGKKLPDTLK